MRLTVFVLVAVSSPAWARPSYDQAMNEARSGYTARNYRRALARAEDALEVRAGDVDALSVAALAACQLRNPDVARKYYRMIQSPQRRGAVQQICYVTHTEIGADRDPLDDAREAYMERAFRRALAFSEEALDEDPKDPDALALAAMSACQLRNAEVAQTYLRKLKGERFNAARQICFTRRVPIGD